MRAASVGETGEGALHSAGSGRFVRNVLVEAGRRAHRLRGLPRYFDDYRVAAFTGAPEDHLHARKIGMPQGERQPNGRIQAYSLRCMADQDPLAAYAELKAAGTSPQAVYEAAKANGLGHIEAIRLLRELFGLTLKAAKDVVALVEGPPEPKFPPIETREQLLKILGTELGYCGCATADTLDLLVRFLRAAQKRSDSTSDPDEFASASRELEACLPLQALPAFADWFVYGLERRDLVSHNFRVTDVWITEKGRWLLEAMERIELDEP